MISTGQSRRSRKMQADGVARELASPLPIDQKDLTAQRILADRIFMHAIFIRHSPRFIPDVYRLRGPQYGARINPAVNSSRSLSDSSTIDRRTDYVSGTCRYCTLFVSLASPDIAISFAKLSRRRHEKRRRELRRGECDRIVSQCTKKRISSKNLYATDRFLCDT